mgnify:FL=1
MVKQQPTGRMIITSIKNSLGSFSLKVAYARKMDGYSMVALFRGRFIFLNDTECPVIIGTCQNCLELRDAKEWVIKPNQKYLRNGVHQYTSGEEQQEKIRACCKISYFLLDFIAYAIIAKTQSRNDNHFIH